MNYITILQLMAFILIMLFITIVSTAKSTTRYITYDTKGEDYERKREDN